MPFLIYIEYNLITFVRQIEFSVGYKYLKKANYTFGSKLRYHHTNSDKERNFMAVYVYSLQSSNSGNSLFKVLVDGFKQNLIKESKFKVYV